MPKWKKTQLPHTKLSKIFIFQLESYMDEAFILKALQEVGEDKVVSVKVRLECSSGNICKV